MSEQDDRKRMERLQALDDDAESLDRRWQDRYVEYQLGELEEEERISPHSGESSRSVLQDGPNLGT